MICFLRQSGPTLFFPTRKNRGYISHIATHATFSYVLVAYPICTEQSVAH